jgi:WD40 repeat protein
VTAGGDGTVQVFDTGDRSRLAVFRRHVRGQPRSFATAVFSANGRVVLTAGADGTARLWHWREPR